MIYTVMHTGVGTWKQGEQLTDADLAGIDKQRLVNLGAILPTGEAVGTKPLQRHLLPLMSQNARHKSNQREKHPRKRQANHECDVFPVPTDQY
jgi:hypothetical protein